MDPTDCEIDELLAETENVVADADPTEDGDTCPICKDSTSTDELVTLPCNHQFHRRCIGRTFNYQETNRVNYKCPLCNQQISVDFLVTNNFALIEGNMIHIVDEFSGPIQAREDDGFRGVINQVLESPEFGNYIAAVNRLQGEVRGAPPMEIINRLVNEPAFADLMNIAQRMPQPEIQVGPMPMMPGINIEPIRFEGIFAPRECMCDVCRNPWYKRIYRRSLDYIERILKSRLHQSLFTLCAWGIMGIILRNYLKS